jgi:heme-degrading monooxygenase HmoA
MNVVHVKEERREAFERTFLERESHVIDTRVPA